MAWNFNLFGLKLGKDEKSQREEKIVQRQTFTQSQSDDGAIVVEPGSHMGYYLNFENTIQSFTDPQLILQYRKMAMYPEVDAAIEDITNESVVIEEGKQPVDIILDDFEEDEIPDETKEKIVEEFRNVLYLLDFNTRGGEIFRRWYVDSRLYYHMIHDPKNPTDGLLEVRWVDPTKICKVKEVERERNADGVDVIKQETEWFIYSPMGMANNSGITDPAVLQGVKISPDAIAYVTSGLYDEENKRVLGYLQKAIKTVNQLRMIEDAVVIYRMSRAPERRVFYIDVGNLQKTQAEAYLRNIMNRFKNKLSYSMTTGQISDEHKSLSMMEDFWLPRREGGKGTEVTTLPGGQNLGEIQDVEYFLKKLYKSLGVPYSRFVEGESSRFNYGRVAEVTRDEMKFQKFIYKLQRKFSELFMEILKVQLNLKNIVSLSDWDEFKNRITLRFNRDAYFTESKDNELLKARLETLSAVERYLGKYYSDEFIRRDILKQTDEQIAALNKEMEKERAAGNYVATSSE